MLFYSTIQSWGSASASDVARIILSWKLIDNGTFLGGRNTILLNTWKGLFGTVNKMRINSKEKIYKGLFNQTFKSQGTVTDPGSLDKPGTLADQIDFG